MVTKILFHMRTKNGSNMEPDAGHRGIGGGGRFGAIRRFFGFAPSGSATSGLSNRTEAIGPDSDPYESDARMAHRPVGGPAAPDDRHRDTEVLILPDRLAAPPSLGRIANGWRAGASVGLLPRAAMTGDCCEAFGFQFVAASVIGRAHAHTGDIRDDHYVFSTIVPRTNRAPIALAVVADGVSGAQFGAQGAERAAHFALAGFHDGNNRNLSTLECLRSGVETAFAEVERYAHDDMGMSGTEVATTLVVAAVEPDVERVTVLSIGDSSAFRIAQGNLGELLVSDSVSTAPLRDYIPRRSSQRFEIRSAFSATDTLLLATDGLATDLMQSPGVRRWVTSQLQTVRNATEASNILQYQRQGSSDDRTFVAVSRIVV